MSAGRRSRVVIPGLPPASSAAEPGIHLDLAVSCQSQNGFRVPPAHSAGGPGM